MAFQGASAGTGVAAMGAGLVDFNPTPNLSDSLASSAPVSAIPRTVSLNVLNPEFTPAAAENARVGSGPASGFLEVSDAYASPRAVQNFASPNATDFIFDSQSGRFVMGNGPLGHDSILQAAGITPSETTVGGTIWRGNGSLMTNEWSGHYGQNWTPEIRQQFQDFMQQRGVNIKHTPWGQ
jgi:hypothetical protein